MRIVRFREPIRRADKRRFGIDIIRSLLLAAGHDAHVDSCCATVSCSCELGQRGGRRGVGCWVVVEQFCNVVGGEEGEEDAQPGEEIGFGCDVVRDEVGAFFGVVTG
jgi:hypothetical protein